MGCIDPTDTFQPAFPEDAAISDSDGPPDHELEMGLDGTLRALRERRLAHLLLVRRRHRQFRYWFGSAGLPNPNPLPPSTRSPAVRNQPQCPRSYIRQGELRFETNWIECPVQCEMPHRCLALPSHFTVGREGKLLAPDDQTRWDVNLL